MKQGFIKFFLIILYSIFGIQLFATNFSLNLDGVSHIYWPINDDKSNWYNATGSDWHKGSDTYADDWNLNYGLSAGYEPSTSCDRDRGAEIISSFSGTVLLADVNGNIGAYGKEVIIQSSIDNSFALRYAHMDTVFVTNNQVVSVGTPLGTVGDSGLPDLPIQTDENCVHLHLVLYENLNTTAIDRLKLGNSPKSLSGGADEYAAMFYTDATSPPPTISNTSISDTTLSAGESATISWNSTNQYQYMYMLYDETGVNPINTSSVLSASCSAGGATGSGGCLGQNNPSNDTSVVWTVPTGLNLGTYTIKVAIWNAEGTAVGGFSQPFTVSQTAILPIISNPNPTDGATVSEGASGQVLRIAVGDATSGTVYYDDDSGISFNTVGNISGGYMEVTIPYVSGKMNNNGTNYWYVEASNAQGTTRYPSSGNMSFTVTQAPALPTISNTSISDTTLSAGESATISWNSTNQYQYMYMLYDETGVNPINTSSVLSASCSAGGATGSGGCLGQNNPSNDTSVVWTVPTGLNLGTYTIKVAIWNAEGTAVGGFSQPFTVSQTAILPTISNTSISDTTLSAGESATISWNSTNQYQYMYMLYDETGVNPINTSSVLSASCSAGGATGSGGCLGQNNPSNDTSVVWTVPTGLNLGTYTIKVAIWNAEGTAVGGFSQPFTVSQTANGIDVSDDQGLINWSNVKADAIDFAYIKSTEGYFEGLSEEELIVYDGLDARYRENMTASLNAGMLVAPYHFVRPDINRGIAEAKKEAAFFVSFIRPYYEAHELLPPAIDIENAPNVDTYCTGGLLGCYTKTTLTDWLLVFAEEVELLLGVEPIFYMNQDFTHNYVDARLASNYKLWIANPSTTRPTPSHWNDWLFWQNSWTGSVSGISGHVDKNIFEGTQSELESYLSQIDTLPEPNPRPWDFNDDNIVDYLDLGILADHWLLDENSPNWNPLVNLDTTADAGIQVINYLDLGVLADHWLE
ncbi:MAG: GH25 family lysozyme [Campylobacterota bacterium]|nr:GH25 family lysozyme [Campylobacterota bacterium]